MAQIDLLWCHLMIIRCWLGFPRLPVATPCRSYLAILSHFHVHSSMCYPHLSEMVEENLSRNLPSLDKAVYQVCLATRQTEEKMKQQRKDKAARQAKEKEWFDLETIGSAIWGPGCQPDWPTLMERNSQTFGGEVAMVYVLPLLNHDFWMFLWMFNIREKGLECNRDHMGSWSPFAALAAATSPKDGETIHRTASYWRDAPPNHSTGRLEPHPIMASKLESEWYSPQGNKY